MVRHHGSPITQATLPESTLYSFSHCCMFSHHVLSSLPPRGPVPSQDFPLTSTPPNASNSPLTSFPASSLEGSLLPNIQAVFLLAVALAALQFAAYKMKVTGSHLIWSRTSPKFSALRAFSEVAILSQAAGLKEILSSSIGLSI